MEKVHEENENLEGETQLNDYQTTNKASLRRSNWKRKPVKRYKPGNTMTVKTKLKETGYIYDIKEND